MPRRLIHVIGILLVVAVLGPGLAFLAIPIFGGATEVEAQRLTVAQANDQQEARIQALAEQQAKLPELNAELGELHKQIPGTPALDTVSKLAVSAARDSGAKLLTFDIGDSAAFTPPSGTESAAAASGDASADVKAIADAPRVQTTVSMSITTASTAEAVRFVDALRTGSRLVQIVSVTTTGNESDNGADAFSTAVSARVFVQH